MSITLPAIANTNINSIAPVDKDVDALLKKYESEVPKSKDPLKEYFDNKKDIKTINYLILIIIISYILSIPVLTLDPQTNLEIEEYPVNDPYMYGFGALVMLTGITQIFTGDPSGLIYLAYGLIIIIKNR